MLKLNTKNLKVAATTGIGKAIEVVNCTMKKVDHALYRSEVFWKAEKGKLFYQSHNFNTITKIELSISDLDL